MSEPGSDPTIGDLQGFLGVGSTCGTCAFRYMEHEGHIIACPVCAFAAALQRLAVAELALGFPIVADHVKRYEDVAGELRAALVRAEEGA